MFSVLEQFFPLYALIMFYCYVLHEKICFVDAYSFILMVTLFGAPHILAL